jgi:hypothetical protein
MDTPQDERQDITEERIVNTSDLTKEEWVKPEITEFKPVTVTRGISYRIGDGISNLC